MQSRANYINKYREQKKELTEKGELWRICVETEEEFIDKLDDIYIESLLFDFINEFQRENTIKAKIHILLQTKLNEKEVEEYVKKREKEIEIADKEAIPMIKKQLKAITTPLDFENIVRISKWIWRNQITFNDLNKDIQMEFKTTKHYEHLKLNNKL